jgi:branched-chain amino acid aminotransferase
VIQEKMGRVIVFRAQGHNLERLSVDANSLDEATLKTQHGIYTVLRMYPDRRVLRLDRHWERMRSSADLLHQPYAIEDGWLRAMLRRAVIEGEQLGITAPRVRVTVPFDAPDTALFTLEPFSPPSAKVYESGVSVELVTARRADPRAKNSRFIEQRQQIEANKAPDCYEVLLSSDDGAILEGVGSNFYGVIDGVLHTADEGILPGIARGILLDVAPDVIRVSKTPIQVSDIPRLSEAMLTSASRGVVPIVRIAGQTVGSGAPGPISRALRQHYEALVEQELEPI